MKIEKLEILTKNLDDQLQFYREVLELEVLQVTKESFEVQLGYSVLKLKQDAQATPYHIAFHIPANQQDKALAWLRQRVGILKDGNREIIDFPAWKAKSIYFYDKDKNVVEFISRKEFFPPKSEDFSAQSLLGISEIGLATSEVKNSFDFLNQKFYLGKFTGDYERFCATGDDEGLFIIINKNEKNWFPSGEKAFASPFQITLSTPSQTRDLSYKNERLELL